LRFLLNSEEQEEDDNEGDKILTVEDFRKRAVDKLEQKKQYNINKNKRGGAGKLRKK
jgi:hypothetical protein